MSDRHFDELATRFAEKIYGGAKGAIRLAVLQADLKEALPERPLRVLDVGAGLGHMSLWLAQRGHQVTLAEPHAILPVLHQLTAADGWLSLAFYNKDALVYRNLLKGHFRKLRKERFAGEGQSLTPQQPLDPRELATQLDALWRVESRSGVRVFHDYMPAEFQAKAELADLLEMELAYRRHPSFAGLGRYLHWVCRPL